MNVAKNAKSSIGKALSVESKLFAENDRTLH